MLDLNFRIGFPNEIESLKKLGIAAYSQYSQILTEANWLIMERFLKNQEMWEDLVNKSKIFVCEDGEKIVGMAYLLPQGNPTNIYPADWSYIRMIGVYPSYRGMGIAKKLTRMCVDYADKSGEKIVGLHTSDVMKDAIHIYEQIGFNLSQEIAPIFGVKYFLYKMEFEK